MREIAKARIGIDYGDSDDDIPIRRYSPETFPLDEDGVRSAGAILTYNCHGSPVACGWYQNVRTGRFVERNVGELLALIHSEVSEALEGHRKDKMDEHLPHRKNVEVELADAVIRIFDLGGALGLDIGSAMAEKMRYNLTRADHRPENRLLAGGKAI